MNKRSDEQNDPFGPFNFSDFKKWMEHQNDSKSKPNLIGLHVESKINYRRLLSRILETQEGDTETVAKDFKRHGGKISDIDGHNVLIEVNSGSFIIHRMHVKRAD